MDSAEISHLPQLLKIAVLAVLAGAFTPACASPFRPEGEPSDKAPSAGKQPGALVKDAHVPLNERFRTLDEYLAFLEKRSAIDDAWYREIEPGLYRCGDYCEDVSINGALMSGRRAAEAVLAAANIDSCC